MISRYMQEQKHVDTIMPDEIVALCKAGQAELASIKKVMKNLKQASDINLNCRKELSDHLDDMTTRFRAIEFAVQNG